MAILGTGTVVKRPVVVEDPTLGEVIAVRSIVYLALTYDHRLIDGADAARFLARSRTAWRRALSRPSSAFSRRRGLARPGARVAPRGARRGAGAWPGRGGRPDRRPALGLGGPFCSA